MEKKKKKRLLFIIILLLGISIALTPFIMNKINEWRIKNLNAQLNSQIDNSEMLGNLNEKASFDYGEVESISNVTSVDMNKKNVIGRITAPSINMDLMIFKGLYNKNLLVGAGTMREDQIMGEGNYPLAGHNDRNNSFLFGQIYRIQKGDKIKITNKSTIYEYKVYDMKVGADNRFDYISNKQSEMRKKPVTVLMSCYYENGRDTGKRYFVFGELVDEYSYSDKNMK